MAFVKKKVPEKGKKTSSDKKKQNRDFVDRFKKTLKKRRPEYDNDGKDDKKKSIPKGEPDKESTEQNDGDERLNGKKPLFQKKGEDNKKPFSKNGEAPEKGEKNGSEDKAEKAEVIKVQDDSASDDDESENKKDKGVPKKQIEMNPPLRSTFEQIKNLPWSLREDALDRLAEEMALGILDALERKARKSGHSPEVILEVFRRGYESGRGVDHLTEEEIGFNRVASFIAGGLARRMDADLLVEMEIEPHNREEGTDELPQSYADDTPGQRFIRILRLKKENGK